jgi:hypothetical protein
MKWTKETVRLKKLPDFVARLDVVVSLAGTFTVLDAYSQFPLSFFFFQYWGLNSGPSP